MKAAFLVRGRDQASVRFRVLQYLPHLRRLGVDADVADLADSLPERVRALRAAARSDVVVVHRAFLSPLERLVLGRSGWVFDFDDALMFRDSNRARQHSWQRAARLGTMVRGARRVIAGNEYLAEWTRARNPRVEVLPTVVDLDAYPAEPPPAPDPPVIGWIGTRPNLPYLDRVLPALRRVTRGRHPPRVVVVADAFPTATDGRIEHRPWRLDREARDVASFSVGIMPLSDDPWTRGKCGLKVLQYFASWVPAVCSPVGVNPEIVRHGESGFLASTEDEWVEAIEALIGDERLRRRCGDGGRRTVEERYSLPAAAERLVALLHGACSPIARPAHTAS
jgi:glycosyltransferase involved in cell wall biosynthesis